MTSPSPAPGSPGRRKVYQVTELTRRIKETLEDAIGMVWVEGEISNLRQPASGHLYFTLKDAQAQLSAVLFKGNRQGLTFAPADGVKVRAQGELTVYEARGNYQLLVRHLEDAGRGDLLEQFEKLKKKLADEGLFDPDRKKPLPMLARHIGVVTSPTGAAIRDILQVLGRRFPNLHILLAPVKVQGEGAARQIANAIEFLNRRDDLEVLLVGRGGGSLEDLWCFNEEVVARAVAASRLPVISCVGHEIDFTLCDFAADHRAPTPSAAAELVVGRKEDYLATLETTRRQLGKALEMHLLNLRHRLTAASRSYVFREPHNLLRHHRQRLDALQASSSHALQSAVRQRQQQVDELALHMQHRAERVAAGYRQDIRRLQDHLRALSPKAVLERGFTITRLDRDGLVRAADDVQPGARLHTETARGTIESDVTACHPGEHHDRTP